MIVTPETLIVADRVDVPGFAATVKVPVPDPEPDAASVIHEAAVDDVQTHDGCVVTVIVFVAPPGGGMNREGLTENVHETLGSVIRNGCPPMVNVAVLATLVVLAAAVNPYAAVPRATRTARDRDP